MQETEKANRTPLADALLAWFYENRRSLPFREDPTPYHIWVSEIMLQQTRMTAVLPYYARFMEALPTVADLAACPIDRLHKLWEGLGYYSRADNLRRAAVEIMENHGGEVPCTFDALRSLPGIGDYTAGAVASISGGETVPAVDGNVMRVFSRLMSDRADILRPETKRRTAARVMEHQPKDAPGDFNQALMELGALVCIPGEARCEVCPLSPFCEAYQAGTVSMLPVKGEKKPRRREMWDVLLIRSPRGWLLTRRPESGLLAGMWQPPLCPRTAASSDIPSVAAFAASLLPGVSDIAVQPLPDARHIFTHIEWEMHGFLLTVDGDAVPPEGYIWADGEKLKECAIPGAFRAYRGFLTGETPLPE